jgi:NhaC family Na+:H+ antiporter
MLLAPLKIKRYSLFTSGGMQKMLGTIWLINTLCNGFGGIMDAIGALARISQAL